LAFPEITTAVVRQFGLNIRYNTRFHAVEFQTCATTKSPNAMQSAVDFVQAFIDGFDINDALAFVHLAEI
jgi:RNA-binding protein PNO1